MNPGKFGFEIVASKQKTNRNLHTQAQLHISDGIGFASAVMPKNVLDQLWTFNNEIKNYAIVVIKGKLVRYSYEDGKTAFIINETPRLVINDILQK